MAGRGGWAGDRRIPARGRARRWLSLALAAALLAPWIRAGATFAGAPAPARALAAVALWSGGGAYYYLRSAPTTRASIVGQVEPGASLTILAGVVGEAEGGNPWWYRVRVGGRSGFLSSDAVDAVADVRSPWVGVATDDGDPTVASVVAYAGPSLSAAVAATFPLGARMTVIGQAPGDALNGADSVWYRVAEGPLAPVYVYSAYVKFAAWGSVPPPAPLLTAASAVAIDARTGAIVYALDDTARRRPASTAKIMTALVALSRRSPATRMTVPDGVHTVTTDVGGSAMGLAPGESLTLRDLLYGLLLPSGNDAAYTIAQNVGGSQSAFVAEMNATAAKLGLRDTHFTNPDGLDEAGEHTTALDLARLARYTLAHQPLFARIVRTRAYTIAQTAHHPAFALQNLNELLGAYPGADGVKTGTTPQAGQNLVAAAHRFGHEVLAVVLGSSDRYVDASALLDYAFAALPPSAGRSTASPRNGSR